MKRQFSISLVMLLALILFGAGCKPDLIISEFNVGTVSVERDATSGKDYWVANATITVKNNGQEP